MVREEAARIEHAVAQRPQPFEALATRGVQRLVEQQRERALHAGRVETFGLGVIGQQACQVVLRGLGGGAVLVSDRFVYQVVEERLQVTGEVDIGLIRAHDKAPSEDVSDVHGLRARTFERHPRTTRAASELRHRRLPPKTGTCL